MADHRRGVDKKLVAGFLEDYIPFITDALFADNVLAAYIGKSSNAGDAEMDGRVRARAGRLTFRYLRSWPMQDRSEP